jgi:SagB-type dehydrogenase family enzyme
MSAAQQYADAVMWRSRVQMEPVDFSPNWRDKPRKAKFFPGADLLPLPGGDYPPEASVDRGLAPGHGPGAPFTLPLLGGMLRDSYGLVARRLAVQANTDLSSLPAYQEANWSRGAASGGGLYPVSVYWAAGAGGPVLPGLYHYSPSRHGLERLLTGDVSGQVRAAIGGADTDQFLLLGIQIWQNSYKYNSFSYHVATMDTGALLQTWRMWAGARGLVADPVLWFDEPRLTGLLGVDPDQEAVFAVVPLRWTAPAAVDGTAPVDGTAAADGMAAVDGTDGAAAVDGAGWPRVRRTDAGKSRTRLDFDSVLAVHRSTVVAGPRPPAGALAGAAPAPVPAGGEQVALPAPAPLDTDVRTALLARRSSFGRFSGRWKTTRAELAALLRATAAGAALPTDVDPAPELTALYVFVNHVEEVEPGAYRFDPATGTLHRLTTGSPGEFLQRNYFLDNYNLEQAGAVLVPTVRTSAVVDAIGDRGYRLVTGTIGAASQAAYVAAAALGVGCGVVLGFDSVSFVEELGLADTGEVPLILMMVGHETGPSADFRAELVR